MKIALDAREFNRTIVKDKNQMPNIENLIHLMADLPDKPEGEAWFMSLDMQYAQGHLPLHQKAAERCSFQIIGVESTGTYHFNVVSHENPVKSTDFQKVIGET